MASRTLAVLLVSAPATVSVIGQQVLDSKASQDYARLFRAWAR